ncbi:MAG: Mur ligase family protein [Actinomycetia bacterium]|nr:Mur ligase family protein [Actinomycetes bacterium]
MTLSRADPSVRLSGTGVGVPGTAGHASAVSLHRYLVSRARFGVRLGLERIEALLARLGHPQRQFASVHVVGTNSKSTVTRMVEELLRARGLSVGAYLSPHVTRWEERIRIGGAEADLASMIDRLAPHVRQLDEETGDPVTQFELLTAAAFCAFAEAGVDAAVIEAGLGGRYDATNTINAPVVVLTGVGLDHQEHLGETREEIAAEKLAVVGRGSTVVVGEREWAGAAQAACQGRVLNASGSVQLAAAAASAFLGERVDPTPATSVVLPGRLEHVGDSPVEVWDGAHNAEGARWLVVQLGGAPHVLVASILRDKPVEEMLQVLSQLATTLVATASTNERALTAEALAARAARLSVFADIRIEPNPVAARSLGRSLAHRSGKRLLVAGSLYLLGDLTPVRQRPVP